MAALNEKETDVVRLEERTKGLERADKAHYLMELILFLGVLALSLIFVSGCRINTPTPNVDENSIIQEKEKEKEKEWVYSENTPLEDFSFTVGEDNESVIILKKGAVYKTIRTSEDKIPITSLKIYLSAVFEENRITLYANGTTLIGTFDYQ